MRATRMGGCSTLPAKLGLGAKICPPGDEPRE